MHLSTLARRLGSVALAAGLALGATACSEDSSTGTDASNASGESGAEESGAEESGEETGSEEATEESTGDTAEEESSSDAPEELAAAEFYPTVMGALKEAETFAFETTTGMAAQQSTVTGEARYADSGMQMQATSTGAQAMEMIMLDEIIYMKAPAMGMGDKWMKIDLRDSSNALFGMLAKATDPEAMFLAMETPKKLELVGTEEVDGVATNHYRVTMDAAKYMKAMGFPAEMSSFLPEELVTDMWVDGDDLPRKFSQTIEIPAPDGGKPTTTTTEGLYHDFGRDVQIEAPPASEVTDAPALPGA